MICLDSFSDRLPCLLRYVAKSKPSQYSSIVPNDSASISTESYLYTILT